ncbi:phosphatase PAP2 family protein [Neolewinella aurantiaca]|uniref:Phosphatase PAP2 family protein n=1 Tax=Neolewinella aurantiaca TaxID=2602767 RepID=A0A5C7FGV1_9BACT|nr:phosphatase PAP2 family protein [Neolewinella aurantiaca]TXF88867.1 phosphatase PAP2 family protein [Neolewinella aurantiaca]
MAIPDKLLTFFRRDKRLLLHFSLFLLAGFLLLTLLVYLLPPSFIDVELSEELQEDRNPLLDGLMQGISWFGNGIVPGILTVGTALVFLLFRARREALFTLLTALAGAVIYVLKVAINRPRPTEDLVTIIEHAQYQSFPSGHVTFYVAFFGFLTFLMYRLAWVRSWIRWSVGLVCLALIFSVPFSRVYLGAHWFTDVLAGFFVGLLCLIGLAKWYSSKPTE